MKHRRSLAALTIAAALPLAACTAPTPAAEPATAQPATSTTTEASAAEQVDAAAPDSRVYAFGDGATYPDSTTPYEVSLTQPQPFTPTANAGGNPGAGGALVFDVIVTNRGDAPLDVSLIWPTASSGGMEAEGIYDTEQDVNAPPATPVLPGNSITYRSAWGVADANDLTVRVPGATYDDPEVLFSLTDFTP